MHTYACYRHWFNASLRQNDVFCNHICSNWRGIRIILLGDILATFQPSFSHGTSMGRAHALPTWIVNIGRTSGGYWCYFFRPMWYVRFKLFFSIYSVWIIKLLSSQINTLGIQILGRTHFAKESRQVKSVLLKTGIHLFHIIYLMVAEGLATQ